MIPPATNLLALYLFSIKSPLPLHSLDHYISSSLPEKNGGIVSNFFAFFSRSVLLKVSYGAIAYCRLFRSLRSHSLSSHYFFLWFLHSACFSFLCAFNALVSAFWFIFRFHVAFFILRAFSVDLILILVNYGSLLLFWFALVSDLFVFVLFECRSDKVCLHSCCILL